MLRRRTIRFAGWLWKHKLSIILWLILILIVGIIFLWATFPNSSPTWTGFGSYTSPTGEVQRAKTLWDWLSILIIPSVLAFGLWWLTKSERVAESEIAQKRAETERKIASERLQAEALQNYLDKMTQLLLDKGLRNSNNDEIWVVARSQTLTTLRSLEDGKLKGTLLQFLYEADLLKQGEKSVDLHDADLTRADLAQVNLVGANLAGVNLGEADLRKAKMCNVCLKNANLAGANLTNTVLTDNADLTNVDLTEATLNGAKMLGANLTDATLVGAKLRGTDLTETILTKAMMHEVELRNANLEKANLAGALIPETELEKVRSLIGATMPSGNVYDI